MPNFPIPSLDNKEFLTALVGHFCPKAMDVETMSTRDLVREIWNNQEASQYFLDNHIPLHPHVMEITSPGEITRRETKQLADMAEWKQAAQASDPKAGGSHSAFTSVTDDSIDAFLNLPQKPKATAPSASVQRMASRQNFDGYVTPQRSTGAFASDADGLPIPSLDNTVFLSALIKRFCPTVLDVEALSKFELVKLIANNQQAAEYFAANHIPLNPRAMERMQPGEIHRRIAKQHHDIAEWESQTQQRSCQNQPALSHEHSQEPSPYSRLGQKLDLPKPKLEREKQVILVQEREYQSHKTTEHRSLLQRLQQARPDISKEIGEHQRQISRQRELGR